MTDTWNRDPAKWSHTPLRDRIEAMRKWHCTGPCGQSAATIGTSNALNTTLRDSKQVVDAAIGLLAVIDDEMANAFFPQLSDEILEKAAELRRVMGGEA